MSFSVEVKKELCQIEGRSGNENRAELAGLIMGGYVLSGRQADHPDRISITTELPFLAARLRRLSKTLYGSGFSVTINEERRQRVYVVETQSSEACRQIKKDARIEKQTAGVNIPPYFLSKQHYFKAYLRGLFLGCGSVSDPAKKYQLELNGSPSVFFENLSLILKDYGISCKARVRGGQGVLDFRGSDSIADFLSLIGASKASLRMTNVRIVKGVRNDVNRKVNCDVANLQKSAKAAGNQISAIRKIEAKTGLGVLPKPLREVAEMRLEHPELSVQELGALMDPPLRKSTLYYRMRKINKYADSL
ncbi:DNA-binding protein WhiA [Pseudoramibacter sp.]|jgi:DNA-binding protein WhiA|uniref:DNA-binding protein WhiA n=1 Tax=Pseudoramibacter sp. TaxID=2034862 RepID=UPI0025E42FA4|nr:DNA-binding protein WhiA [Pseudoramibacter sp.]MCH4071357.1 DNA-binding protein WhiA [Pseudoramibacter sp.]MCH4105125.1 DNA-binding protein WhiA [Pseudoramibacter sp.]